MAQTTTSDQSPEEEKKENDAEQDEDNDNVDTPQLAWDVLEIARGLYEKHAKENGEASVHTQLINTYQRLADASLEAGRNEDAAADYRKALALQKKYLDAHDPSIGDWFPFAPLPIILSLITSYSIWFYSFDAS